MRKLNKKEQSEILNLSKKFIEIHSKIVEVEKQIQSLENKSSELISELESCREIEREFCRNMENKYGEGQIDPIEMSWITKKEMIK
jgi:hypothetical protein